MKNPMMTTMIMLTVKMLSKLDELISEQQSDITLKDCIHQAQLSKGNYYFKSGALFHREKIANQWVEQLVLPVSP